MATVDHRWFQPLPKQLAFLRCRERESVYAGGFGSGKTLSGGFRALKAAIDHPGTVGLVARQTYRALEDSTKKVLVDGDDKPAIFAEELGYWVAGDFKFVFHNGSEVLFRSFQDSNEEKILGPNYGFIYVDELTECSERIWRALMSRLRHPAGPEQAWGTTNPNGHDWVWKRFHLDAGKPQGPLFHAPSEENTHLSRTYIAWLRSQPLEWQKRYVDANFDTAAGMIWEEWDRNVHVVSSDVDARLGYDWRRFESLDHGRRNPTAYLQCVVDPEGFMLVEDEYYNPGIVSVHATAIVAKRTGRTWGAIVSDPQVFVADAYGNTPAAAYSKLGIRMIPADNAVGAGLGRVSEWLMRRPDREFPSWHEWAGTLGPDGKGSPLLFVHERCTSLLEEIPNYVWRDLSPSQEDTRDQPEEPRKKDDHACDALRYAVMSQPKPNPAPAEKIESDSRRDERYEDRREFSAGILQTTF